MHAKGSSKPHPIASLEAGIAKQTYYRWRREQGQIGLEGDDSVPAEKIYPFLSAEAAQFIASTRSVQVLVQFHLVLCFDTQSANYCDTTFVQQEERAGVRI